MTFEKTLQKIEKKKLKNYHLKNITKNRKEKIKKISFEKTSQKIEK